MVKTKQIQINEKEYFLKELRYLDVVELSDIKDRKNHAIKLLELSGIPKEDIEQLSTVDGANAMEVINEINGFSQNFQVTESAG